MRRLSIILGLECYALLLAWVQSLGGIRTDEAKYLLNIPYPHPPLLRWIMGQTEWVAHQELLWRVILATLVIQSVWWIWNSSRDYLLCFLWLASAAVILQAGSIMMAPVTAVGALVLIIFYYKQHPSIHPAHCHAECFCESKNVSKYDNGLGTQDDSVWIALLWLASLFTAYQAILYAPLAYVLLRKHKVYFALPIILLALYTITNPLILQSFLNAGTQNTGLDPLGKVNAMLVTWVIGGSGVLSLLGTAALVKSRSRALLLSFQLVTLYILVSHRSYYAILFTPLLIGGLLAAPQFLRERVKTIISMSIASATLLWLYPFETEMSDAREMLNSLTPFNPSSISIHGPFGHEWQYESSIPITRYTKEKITDVLVCLYSCKDLNLSDYKRLEEAEIETYVFIER